MKDVYETLLNIARERRSIRAFTEQEVSRVDIEKIVRIGIESPSGFNSQPWKIIAVDDAVLRDNIATSLLQVIGNGKTSKGFTTAPVYLLLYGDTSTRENAPPAKKDDDNWWNFTFTVTLANAFMSMQLAAASLGLGSMWVSASRTPQMQTSLRDTLNIPEHYQLYEMLALGYPRNSPPTKKLKNISDILQYNIIE